MMDIWEEIEYLMKTYEIDEQNALEIYSIMLLQQEMRKRGK